MLLAIPALAVLILFDLIAIVTVGLEGVKFIAILQYLISGVTAFIGAYLSIMLARNILQKTGIFVFSYYCWGAAIFTFILYLI
jgi:undecaprenyl pyrophosphate phosphatase UppP